MTTATVTLKEYPWESYFQGKKWVGKASAKDRVVRARRGLRWMRHVPLLKRIPIRVYAHELDHLRLRDFTGNADHHDDPRWVAAAPEGETRKLHECGRSYSIKADDAKTSWPLWKKLWSMRRWFSLKHLSLESIVHAKTLLSNGSVDVPYEEGSSIWVAVNSQ